MKTAVLANIDNTTHLNIHTAATAAADWDAMADALLVFLRAELVTLVDALGAPMTGVERQRANRGALVTKIGAHFGL